MEKLYFRDHQGYAWEHEGKKFQLHIQTDADPMDPRKDMDNLGVFVVAHPRYVLGDVDLREYPNASITGYLLSLVEKTMSSKEVLTAILNGELHDLTARVNRAEGTVTVYTTTSPVSMEALCTDVHLKGLLDYLGPDLDDGHLVTLLKPYMEIVPLYLFDHSGISIRTSRFNDPWDSGMVGYVFVSKATVLKNWPELANKGDEEWRKKAHEAIVEPEVWTYDQYLQGQVYGYTIYEECADGDYQAMDGCSGFFGNELMESGIAEDVGYGFKEAIESGNYATGYFKIPPQTYVFTPDKK